MADVRAATQELQSRFLDTIRKGQDVVADAVKAWADVVQAVTPDVPAVPQFTDKLPKPDEVVSTAYDFAERLLATQRQFAEKVARVTTPVLVRTGGGEEG